MDSQKPVWAERMKPSPFSKTHFTDEMRGNVMQKLTKKNNKNRRWFAASSVAVLLVVAIALGVAWLGRGPFAQNSPQVVSGVVNEWEPSSFFSVNGQSLLGHKGKVGILKLNEDQGEAFLTSKKGIVYQIYFWGTPESFKGTYKITATKKDTKEAIRLYEWPIEQAKEDNGAVARSGGKFIIDSPGLWRFDIYVNDAYFDHLVVDVK